MKSATMIIGAIIIILLMGATLAAINSFRMAEYEEPHNVITASANTADIVLSQAVFNDATYNIVVASNLTADAPVPSSYASATKTLTVSGLQEDATRRLTVTYKYDGLEDYYAAGLAARIWPILLGLGVIGLITGAVYNAMKHGD